MKKILFSLCIILSLTLVLGTSVFAEHDDKVTGVTNSNLKRNDIERLLNFGFSEEEVEKFTPTELQMFNEKYGKDSIGQLVSKETKYYRINSGNVVEITKSDADKEVKAYEAKKQQKSKKNKEGKSVQVLASDTETTSWLSMTTTSSAYLIPQYNHLGQIIGYIQDGWQLKNSFTWLVNPLYKLTDVLGLSMNPNLTYVQNTEFAVYNRTCGYLNPYTQSDFYFTANTKSTTGLAFNIDLKAYSDDNSVSAYDHRGYMIFNVRKNNSTATSTNAFGHYSHLYNTINFSVSISTGAMSVSGTTQKDTMTDTGISFSI